MVNKQSDVDMKEEVITARILTAVFVSFMILIVGSYSDIQETDSKQPVTAQTLVQSIENVKSSTQTSVMIKTHLKQSLSSM